MNISKIESFGYVAAENDAILQYFLKTPAVADIESGRYMLVLGRKGTGKTALVRYFSEHQDRLFSQSLNLRGYPWQIHASRIDQGASEIEAYVASWKYLIAVQMAVSGLAHISFANTNKGAALENFLRNNYGGAFPDIKSVLQPRGISLSSLTISPQILGNSVGSISFERQTNDLLFGTELNALSDCILDAVREAAADAGIPHLTLHFDELDQGISQLDESRRNLIIGLVIAALSIRRDSQQIGFRLGVILYLRSDIWDDIYFADKNKITQSSALTLSWNGESLKDLIEKRAQVYVEEKLAWTDIADPALMRGSQTKWNHILSRTFLRPRDVIQFLNIGLRVAKQNMRNKIENDDILAARDEYSSYLRNELDEEIMPHWPFWKEALRTCTYMGTITFDKDSFLEKYLDVKSAENPLDGPRALNRMYDFSVIGYEKRSGHGGVSWNFHYSNPQVGWDPAARTYKVHLGLKEYAKLREARQS